MPFKIKAELRAELRDAEGNVIRRLPWRPANSLLKQFIQLLTIMFQQAAITVTRTTGVGQSIGPAATVLRVNGAAGATNNGIVIGTGTNPVTMTDYNLQAQASANIDHGITTFAVENPDANTWRVAISRIFTNNTGATLGIREVGLFSHTDPACNTFLIERTLYSVDVPNGVAVTLTYRITVTL